jgi:hypothetical protein
VEVGDKHHAVPLPVSFHLLGLGHPAYIFRRRFGFDHTAGGVLNQEGIVLDVGIACLAAKLIGREQAPVRQPGATIGEVDDTTDFGGKGLPDVREQSFLRRIEGGFRHI